MQDAQAQPEGENRDGLHRHGDCKASASFGRLPPSRPPLAPVAQSLLQQQQQPQHEPAYSMHGICSTTHMKAPTMATDLTQERGDRPPTPIDEEREQSGRSSPLPCSPCGAPSAPASPTPSPLPQPRGSVHEKYQSEMVHASTCATVPTAGAGQRVPDREGTQPPHRPPLVAAAPAPSPSSPDGWMSSFSSIVGVHAPRSASLSRRDSFASSAASFGFPANGGKPSWHDQRDFNDSEAKGALRVVSYANSEATSTRSALRGEGETPWAREAHTKNERYDPPESAPWQGHDEGTVTAANELPSRSASFTSLTSFPAYSPFQSSIGSSFVGEGACQVVRDAQQSADAVSLPSASPSWAAVSVAPPSSVAHPQSRSRVTVHRGYPTPRPASPSSMQSAALMLARARERAERDGRRQERVSSDGDGEAFNAKTEDEPEPECNPYPFTMGSRAARQRGWCRKLCSSSSSLRDEHGSVSVSRSHSNASSRIGTSSLRAAEAARGSVTSFLHGFRYVQEREGGPINLDRNASLERIEEENSRSRSRIELPGGSASARSGASSAWLHEDDEEHRHDPKADRDGAIPSFSPVTSLAPSFSLLPFPGRSAEDEPSRLVPPPPPSASPISARARHVSPHHHPKWSPPPTPAGIRSMSTSDSLMQRCANESQFFDALETANRLERVTTGGTRDRDINDHDGGSDGAAASQQSTRQRSNRPSPLPASFGTASSPMHRPSQSHSAQRDLLAGVVGEAANDPRQLPSLPSLSALSLASELPESEAMAFPSAASLLAYRRRRGASPSLARPSSDADTDDDSTTGKAIREGGASWPARATMSHRPLIDAATAATSASSLSACRRRPRALASVRKERWRRTPPPLHSPSSARSCVSTASAPIGSSSSPALSLVRADAVAGDRRDMRLVLNVLPMQDRLRQRLPQRRGARSVPKQLQLQQQQRRRRRGKVFEPVSRPLGSREAHPLTQLPDSVDIDVDVGGAGAAVAGRCALIPSSATELRAPAAPSLENSTVMDGESSWGGDMAEEQVFAGGVGDGEASCELVMDSSPTGAFNAFGLPTRRSQSGRRGVTSGDSSGSGSSRRASSAGSSVSVYEATEDEPQIDTRSLQHEALFLSEVADGEALLARAVTARLAAITAHAQGTQDREEGYASGHVIPAPALLLSDTPPPPSPPSPLHRDPNTSDVTDDRRHHYHHQKSQPPQREAWFTQDRGGGGVDGDDGASGEATRQRASGSPSPRSDGFRHETADTPSPSAFYRPTVARRRSEAAASHDSVADVSPSRGLDFGDAAAAAGRREAPCEVSHNANGGHAHPDGLRSHRLHAQEDDEDGCGAWASPARDVSPPVRDRSMAPAELLWEGPAQDNVSRIAPQHRQPE